jgi:invasion protein IalB
MRRSHVAGAKHEESVMTNGNAHSRNAYRPVARALVTATLALAVGGAVFAQAPAPAPKAQPKQLPKAAPKAPPQAAPTAPAGGEAQQQQAQGEQPKLIYSPWTKFCVKGQEANAQGVCFTGKDGRLETGAPVVAAVLIEPDNDPNKILRVTLPLGMSLQDGTRVIVDQGQPMTAPYVICFANGCMADYEASGELISRLKQGQGLVVQGKNAQFQPITLVLPLADFGRAYDGPPTDPKVFEEQQKRLQDDLQKRAEELARRQQQGGQPAASH